MCGIIGVAGSSANRQLAEAMLDVVLHRGPDGRGIYQDQDLFIGQTRLSIIDLVTGSQPMSNEDKNIWVVYNGEIYNFPELRCRLEERGHKFLTTSDTEVLIHGYEEYGIEFIKQLDGIFAYALWDVNNRRLLIARDCFGIKPLYYHFDGDTLRFGSEIKSLLQDPSIIRMIDQQSMHYFLNLRYIPGEGTLFKGIKKLPPASYMIFEDGKLRIDTYYHLEPERFSIKKEEFYIEGVRHYLREAVRKQMISDVPLGVYLSGGLDSSSIVAFMSEVSNSPIQTFSMGFNEPTDELVDARMIAGHFNTNHHEISVDVEPLQEYPRVIWHAEEPKENILQGFLLSRFARQYVKVILGGLGGDELFAGYINNHFIYPSQPFHQLVPPWMQKNLLQPVSRWIFSVGNASGSMQWDEYRRAVQLMLSAGDPEQYYLILRNVWDYDAGAVNNIYGDAINRNGLRSTSTLFDSYFPRDGKGVLEQALWTEFHTKMIDDFLMNEDRTSMANGLEVRVPFLDRDLVRFAMGIPVEYKYRNYQTKYIFRRAMTGILPSQTIRKKKWGFSFNPYYQFQKDLKKVADKVLARKVVQNRGWFNYEYIRRILDRSPNPRMRWHYNFLWLATGLEIWAQMFLDGDVKNPRFELEHYVSVSN